MRARFLPDNTMTKLMFTAGKADGVLGVTPLQAAMEVELVPGENEAPRIEELTTCKYKVDQNVRSHNTLCGPYVIGKLEYLALCKIGSSSPYSNEANAEVRYEL